MDFSNRRARKDIEKYVINNPIVDATEGMDEEDRAEYILNNGFEKTRFRMDKIVWHMFSDDVNDENDVILHIDGDVGNSAIENLVRVNSIDTCLKAYYMLAEKMNAKIEKMREDNFLHQVHREAIHRDAIDRYEKRYVESEGELRTQKIRSAEADRKVKYLEDRVSELSKLLNQTERRKEAEIRKLIKENNELKKLL